MTVLALWKGMVTLSTVLEGMPAAWKLLNSILSRDPVSCHLSPSTTPSSQPSKINLEILPAPFRSKIRTKSALY